MASISLRSISTALVLAASSGMPCAADEPAHCLDTAETQADMNRCAASSFKSADAQLNAVYQAVLGQHRADKAFIRNLQASQRAWLAWRDAEIKVLFPDRDAGTYGSAWPMCRPLQLEQLTRQRILQLRAWLDGVPEGDVCAGSMPSVPR